MNSFQCQKPVCHVYAGVLILKTTYAKALMNGENHGWSKNKHFAMTNCSYLNNSVQIPQIIAFIGFLTPNPKLLFKKQLYI